MAQYIDKDAVLAEIERRRKQYANERNTITKNNENYHVLGRIKMCDDILSFIDTLEVKEVDLEEELQQHLKDCLNVKFPTTDVELIKKDVEYTARKFFELGLKAQKGEKV